MAYTKSNNIQIFPVTNRPKYDPAGRLTTEYNLTSLLNKLLDVDGFVITTNPDAINTINSEVPFDFNIHGYMIHIKNIKDIIPSNVTINGTQIYAILKIQTASNSAKNLRVDHISGGDDDNDNNTSNDNNSEYTGIIFETLAPKQTLPTSPGVKEYYLPILEYCDGEWSIPVESKLKFKTNSEGYSSVAIDDGEV